MEYFFSLDKNTFLKQLNENKPGYGYPNNNDDKQKIKKQALRKNLWVKI